MRSKAACMVVSGLPRSGKSTIIRRTTRDITSTVRNLHIKSTHIVEPMQVRIKRIRAEKGSQASWVEKSIQDETRQTCQHSLVLAAAVRDDKPHANPFPQSNHPPRSGHRGTSQPPTSSIPQRMSGPNPQPPGPSLEKMPPFLPPDEMMRTALENLSILKDSEDLDGAVTFQIFDTGGQPEFQSPLMQFIKCLHITAQVFNLSIGLNERYDVRYVREVGQTSVPYKSHFTVQEVLFQAQSCLAYLETPRCPPGFPCATSAFRSKSLFVGTHRDRVSAEEVARIDDALKKQLKSSPFLDDTVVYHHDPQTGRDNVVIAVDNTNADDSGIRHFRDRVNEILDEIPSSELPVTWQWFKLSVLSTESKTMSVDQCVVIGIASGMDGKPEVLLALWYHTQFTGLFQHYDIDGIREIVWLDPQIITDGMSLLASRSFYTGGFNQKQAGYRDTGRFPVEEVKKILKEHCDEVPPENLITLFAHLNIVSPIYNEEGKVVEYFIPCVLRAADLEKMERREISANHPATLLVTHDTGFTPFGVFHALVVRLSSPNVTDTSPTWELRTAADSQFRNKIEFLVGDNDKVTLIDRPQFIEVQVDRKIETSRSPPLSKVCNAIRLAIGSALTHVKSSNATKLEVAHQMAFYCHVEQCDPVPHTAFRKGSDSDIAICSFSKERCVLGPHHLVWFGEDTDRPDLSSCILTSDDLPKLMRVLGEAAHCTEQLGIQLHLSTDTIATLKAQAVLIPGFPITHLSMMLSEWLKRMTPPPTLQALTDALSGPPIGNQVLARKIREAFERS